MEKNTDSKDLVEENIIQKGVSLQELLETDIKLKNKNSDKKIDIVALANRFDLSETYLREDGNNLVLMAPVRTAGDYSRNFVLIRKNGREFHFTLTYPNPSNKRHFYVSDLEGSFLKEVSIGKNGQESASKKRPFKSGDCLETVNISCSSGNHSFANPGSVWECTYWANPSAGAPPQKFKMPGKCGGGGGGGGGGGSVNPDPPSGGPSGPISGGGGGGDPTIPPGDTALPPLIPKDCVENLDCEDCMLPGDLNDDCMVTEEETTSSDLGLNRLERNWFMDGENYEEQQRIMEFLGINQYSEEAKDFANAAIDALIDGGEVDFEERIIYTSNVLTCVKNIIKKMLNDNEYIDLGDMPDFVKQELNLSGVILNFFNTSNKYNLIFDSKNNLVNAKGQRLNASTNPERDPNDRTIINFTITLDSDYVRNATDLSVARTIIHETLHAYISYIYQDQMFSNLSNSLRTLLSVNGATPNSAQHILMTQQFVNAISNSLESWDNSSLANHEYYNYLSWSGAMLDTPAFDDLDGNIQQAIKDANIAEGSALYPATGQAQGTNNCN